MVQLSTVVALVAGATLPGLSQAATGLNTAAKAAGLKYFGTATDNNELSNAAYLKELENTADFGQLTAANSMKWGPTNPSSGVYTYTQGDQIASQAKNNGQLLRCHNLVWYNQLPSYISNGQWTNATLLAAMEAHITSAVTHFKGQCYCWDVVNEALNDDGTYRSDVLYNTIGPAYIPLAFKYAQAADPNVKLYYNDYNIETAGAKSTAAQNIVKMIKSYGLKIDGVGLQAHYIVGSTPSTSAQASNLQTFTNLGVEVAFTELDIRETLPETSALDTQQAKDYASTVNACLQVDGCVGVTVWDFDDQYSWVPSTFSGQGAADLFNSQLQAKPAYTAVLSALNAAATGGSSPAPTTTAAGTKPTTTLSTVATPTQTSSSGSGAGTVAEWGQCGGIGWTGGTVCVSPYTCHVSNSYYSQCY
ncbi:hypothetical protein MMC10_005929 [Thelotrema lepadinum]|nr:hypothetical protein [Thelotrema lepadinum]